MLSKEILFHLNFVLIRFRNKTKIFLYVYHCEMLSKVPVILKTIQYYLILFLRLGKVKTTSLYNFMV